MFLSSYENLRQNVVMNNTISSMLHFGRGVFGADFGTTSFVIKKKLVTSYRGTYRRLFEKQSAVDSIETKKKWFFEGKGYHIAKQSDFSKITGTPIAYWISNTLLHDFTVGDNLKERGDTRQGMATSDNNRFLRLWYEVNFNCMGIGCKTAQEAIEVNKKWYPYNKGGEYRKWYGNIDYVINYERDGFEVKQYATSLYKSASRTIKSMSEYFKHCLSWSKVTIGSIAFRYYPDGFIFDVAGCCIFYQDDSTMFYDFGFTNSIVAKSILSVISPTLNYEAGHIATLPVIQCENEIEEVGKFTRKNVKLSKCDWDSFETSWDYKTHPLVRLRMSGAYAWGDNKPTLHLSSAYKAWSLECNARFDQLKSNEKELNRIFIDIYGLQDELTPEVEEKDVTVARIYDTKEEIPESMKGNNYVLTKCDVIKSLLSFAVGCMFGRYSLDVSGLAYAGGEWDDSKYSSFIPDKDNIIPITDEEYFKDDIVGRFVEFVKAVYGEETLEENLDFIANALGNKGSTSREVIRNYFLNDFFKDHCKTYKKRPIYWLFDSGKQNGFKALIYLHRYNENTIGNLRIDYLHRMERVYESEIARMQDTIDNGANAREVTAATKRKEKLQKQIKECKDYDEKIAHLALARIAIDLDDGVKANYEKVQTDTDGKSYQVLAKI
jgi:hypothetical protein